MNARRLMISALAAAAAVAVLLALHHRRTVDYRAQSVSVELRVMAGATSSVTSLASAAPRPSKAQLGNRSSHDPATTGASKLINSADNIPSTDTVQPGFGTSSSADSPSEPPTQPNSKPPRPKFWQTDNNDGYTLITDHQFVHTGSSSAILELSSGQIGAESTAAVFQACSATDFRGKHARFTIFLRGDDGFGSAEAWLRVDDPTQSRLPINVVREPASLPSPPDWAPVSVTIDVSPSATILTYGVILHGTGPLRIDTAQLNFFDADGAKREEPARDPTAEDGGVGAAPRYPRNMDFEESIPSP